MTHTNGNSLPMSVEDLQRRLSEIAGHIALAERQFAAAGVQLRMAQERIDGLKGEVAK